MRVEQRYFNVITLGAILVIAALCIGSQLDAASEVLDGRTFIVKTGVNGKQASDEDELSFRSGKFYSSSCIVWDFSGGEYSTRVEGDIIYFEAVTLSKKHGRIVWSGEIKGDNISGTYIWTKQRWYWRDARQEKWFEGRLKS